ncbi:MULTISPECIES: hypothetical protein [Actinomycetes]|uniref:hypothetical protein n=1 Tax=Actinomycetes TaxID=1760 RepID=UPI0004C0492B|nr:MULTISPECIES: hypothetical protein [Actinomycetes]
MCGQRSDLNLYRGTRAPGFIDGWKGVNMPRKHLPRTVDELHIRIEAILDGRAGGPFFATWRCPSG